MRIRRTIVAEQDLLAALIVHTIVEVIRLRLTAPAATEDFGVGRKLHVHTAIEDVQGALPEAGIPIFFAVAHDAAINLVDLFEATILHQGAQHLAADATGAVTDDWLILHPVIFAAFQLLDEVMGGVDIRHHSIFKLADLRLHSVATIKEDNIITAFFNQLVDLFRL